jgi:hypothetical protein
VHWIFGKRLKNLEEPFLGRYPVSLAKLEFGYVWGACTGSPKKTIALTLVVFCT